MRLLIDSSTVSLFLLIKIRGDYMDNNNQLQALIEDYRSDYTKDHLRIIEMVLQIENENRLDSLYYLTKSMLKREQLSSLKLQDKTGKGES